VGVGRTVSIVIYSKIGGNGCNSVNRAIPPHPIGTPAVPGPPTLLMPDTRVRTLRHRPLPSADKPEVKVDNVINNCLKLLRNHSLIPRRQSRYLSISVVLPSNFCRSCTSQDRLVDSFCKEGDKMAVDHAESCG
jgi:hypothetical protein